jgi:hypothetical protein
MRVNARTILTGITNKDITQEARKDETAAQPLWIQPPHVQLVQNSNRSRSRSWAAEAAKWVNTQVTRFRVYLNLQWSTLNPKL